MQGGFVSPRILSAIFLPEVHISRPGMHISRPEMHISLPEPVPLQNLSQNLSQNLEKDLEKNLEVLETAALETAACRASPALG
jgi:hypothetical protein